MSRARLRMLRGQTTIWLYRSNSWLTLKSWVLIGGRCGHSLPPIYRAVLTLLSALLLHSEHSPRSWHRQPTACRYKTRESYAGKGRNNQKNWVGARSASSWRTRSAYGLRKSSKISEIPLKVYMTRSWQPRQKFLWVVRIWKSSRL